MSEWADRERRLSPEDSAEPGRWDTSRAEYQRGIMDAISDHSVSIVVIMSSAQVGKTAIISNVLGYHIDQDPAPMLLMQPTVEMAETFSKDRLAPMVRDTPALNGKIADPKSRNSGNTVLHKTFPGGHVTMVGANSPSSLASRPIRVALMDEVDRYPFSAGTEGDPVSLARKRTTTFWNRKVMLASTPTVKGTSRIEQAFYEGDQRRFYVPCPHCDAMQTLKWSNVRWPEDRPQEAMYLCEECGTLWTDVERWQAVRGGHWVAEADFNGVASFHLSELYSPWVKLSEIAQAFLDSKGNPERLKTWTNTSLGETWEETGDTVDAGGLRTLCEPYGPDTLPSGVLYATAGVDVQDDRLEVEIVGWGSHEESAGIAYHVLHGDPSQLSVWRSLDEVLLEKYRTVDGRTVRIEAAAVDSGGHFTEMVYRFCTERYRRRIFAIKGTPGPKPIWPQRYSATKGRHRVWMVGVDTAKELVYARFKIREPGPGYCHLPADPDTGYDEDWFDQVTSESKVTRYREGRPYHVWTLPKGKRNEALDCRVYAVAAMRSMPAPRRPGAQQRKRSVSSYLSD